MATIYRNGTSYSPTLTGRDEPYDPGSRNTPFSALSGLALLSANPPSNAV